MKTVNVYEVLIKEKHPTTKSITIVAKNITQVIDDLTGKVYNVETQKYEDPIVDIDTIKEIKVLKENILVVSYI